jgi:predicted ribosome quality control (RQC) complex YloA/Tae2 family protein
MIETDEKEYFYILPLTHLNGTSKVFPTISEMLDRYYYGKAARDRVKQQGNDLERFVQNELKKNKTKIKKLQATLKDAEKAEKYKLRGELITANMYAIKRGDKTAEVINYYDGEKVSITLNPQKTPSENAQAYFQKYNKAKKSVAFVEEQISLAENEILYFENVYQQIESASPKDIEEIREELMDGGYLKKKQVKGNKKNKPAKIVLEKYSASDGTEILVGKNNKQNDYLTNKTAARDDIWLHTKDIPGSHVVIRSQEPSE